MTRRTVRTLGLILLATPLIAVGCGGGDNGGGTGGTSGFGGSAIDSRSGTGGARVEAGGIPDASPLPVDGLAIDTTVAPDAIVLIDATVLPDVPLLPDASVYIDVASALDVNLLDVSQNDTFLPVLDVAASEAQPVDTTPVIDSTPVVLCTETTKFSGGDVTANRTLTKACSPYTIAANIQVTGNAILTIEAGVRLKFETGTELDVGNKDNAGLVAIGTAAEPITFTSAVAVQSAGDWSTIYFGANVMAGTKIAYANVDYCGSDGYACVHTAGSVKPSRVTLDHLNIDHVGTNGITEEDAATNLTITNSTFSNIPSLQYAISVLASSFAGIGGTNVFNGGAMIEIRGGTVVTTTSWVDPGTPIAVTDRLNVGATSSPVLTIGAGVKFMFGAAVEMDIGSPDVGQLVVAGTAAKHVTFTSLAASPSPGDWSGLYIDYGAKATISYADFSYGSNGGADGGDLIFYSPYATASLVVDNSSFTYSLGYGIELDCTTTTPLPNLQLTNNTYAHNGSDTANANTPATNVGPGLTCTP